MEKRFDWEPSYGFSASNKTDNEVLAAALEAVRRKICVYGGGDYCDCKYGIAATEPTGQFSSPRAEQHGSEQSGCPELREMINRLLHRPSSFSPFDIGGSHEI